jgi:HAD superfamily hydrolase (TIGR01549 family)
MTLPGVKAVLLDVDGTLLHSNDQQARAWLDALHEAGVAVEYGDVRSRVGKGSDKMVDELCGSESASSIRGTLEKRASEIFLDRYLAETRPTRGVRELLERFKDCGLRLVVATSAGGEMLDALLEQAGVTDLIDDSATSTDVSASKPCPDLIHAALVKAGVAFDQAVMLGDTPYDVEAARAAGVRTVALRCGGWWDDAAFTGAVAVFDDPATMLAKLEHLLAPLKLHVVDATSP